MTSLRSRPTRRFRVWLLAVVLLALVGGEPSPADATETEPQTVTGSRAGVIQFVGVGPFRSGPARQASPARAPAGRDQPGDSPKLSPFAASEFTRFGVEAGDREATASADTANVIDAANSLPVDNQQRGLELSFDGLSSIDTRLARNRNQFSDEPPDQGLCAGNGFVLESVNQALRVRDREGVALTPVVAMSSFYGYPPDIDRSTGVYGPDTFDISCYFDPDTKRWFHVALTWDNDRDTGALTGANRLDIAVSRTGDPRGLWNYYAIPTQNDGTEGTPNHRCGGPCFADFPHVGADRNGFYISANEFPLLNFDRPFRGAELYAISKRDLTGGARQPTTVQFETLRLPGGGLAFTVWPAQTPDGRFEESSGGTEYLLSNTECAARLCADDRTVVWAIPNTGALRNPRPSLNLLARAVHGLRYSTPPPARQRFGPFPLGQCINDTAIKTPLGRGCWRYFFQDEPLHNERLPLLDASASNRVGQVTFVANRLWSAQATAVQMGGEVRDGALYSVLVPEVRASSAGPVVDARIKRQRRFGVAGHDVAYPTVAVAGPGREVLSFSLSGEDMYPSSAYVRVTSEGFEPVQIAARGRGPIEGFTAYRAFEGDAAREFGSRYGDYGAVAVDGDVVWIANEYAGQRCSLSEYVAGISENPALTCGRTRTAFSNWYTRVSKIRLP